jgi:hypothetical protein
LADGGALRLRSEAKDRARDEGRKLGKAEGRINPGLLSSVVPQQTFENKKVFHNQKPILTPAANQLNR